MEITRRTFAGMAAAGLSTALTGGNATAMPEYGGTSPEPLAAPSRRRRRRAPSQFRGMWITTVANRDWPSAGASPAEQQKELAGRFEVARERRLNAAILQVRPNADAFWPSPYEPWSQFLTGRQGQDPGWDPVGFAVKEAHRAGLQFHAWFNPYRIANFSDPSRLAAGHPARTHPEWTVVYDGQLYYNPGLPQVRRFVEEAMLDVVNRYDIDGIHWDDYFYPYPVPGETLNDDGAYREYGRGFPDRAAWRRNNVDLLVAETAAEVRKRKPNVVFGISPFGVWRNAATDPAGSPTQALQSYDDLHADTRKWVQQRWVDYIAPQLYWPIGFAAADYAKLVPWWAETVAGTNVGLYIGEALYEVGQTSAWRDPAELSRHLTLGQDHPQVGGNIYFSATEVATDPLGAMTRIVADHYQGR